MFKCCIQCLGLNLLVWLCPNAKQQPIKNFMEPKMFRYYTLWVCRACEIPSMESEWCLCPVKDESWLPIASIMLCTIHYKYQRVLKVVILTALHSLMKLLGVFLQLQVEKKSRDRRVCHEVILLFNIWNLQKKNVGHDRIFGFFRVLERWPCLFV